MSEIFRMDNNLLIRGDVLNNGIETKYDFTFCDKESNQFGKVTMRCEDFKSIDEDSDRKIKDAAETCNNNLADWWKTIRIMLIQRIAKNGSHYFLWQFSLFILCKRART